MDKETKRGRGRPKKTDRYRNHFNIRLSDEEFNREALRTYDIYVTVMEKFEKPKK